MAESNGVWLDKETGKVVTKQPARGRLLVSPNKDANADEAKATVARHEENYATANLTDDTDKTVTAASTNAAPLRAAAKKK